MSSFQPEQLLRARRSQQITGSDPITDNQTDNPRYSVDIGHTPQQEARDQLARSDPTTPVDPKVMPPTRLSNAPPSIIDPPLLPTISPMRITSTAPTTAQQQHRPNDTNSSRITMNWDDFLAPIATDLHGTPPLSKPHQHQAKMARSTDDWTSDSDRNSHASDRSQTLGTSVSASVVRTLQSFQASLLGIQEQQAQFERQNMEALRTVQEQATQSTYVMQALVANLQEIQERVAAAQTSQGQPQATPTSQPAQTTKEQTPTPKRDQTSRTIVSDPTTSYPTIDHRNRPTENRTTQALITRQLKDIPKYTTGARIDEWARTVRDILSIVDVDPAAAHVAVVTALTPAATGWLRESRAQTMEWREIIDAAVDYFGGRAATLRGLREFDQMKRLPSQSIHQWGDAVRQAFYEFDPDAKEARKVQKFINGFSGDMASTMTGLETVPDTLQAAIEVAAIKEYALTLTPLNPGRALKAVNVVSVANKSDSRQDSKLDRILEVLLVNGKPRRTGVCYRCRKEGHFKSECTEPERQPIPGKPWCEYHRTTSHGNADCKRDTRPTPQTPDNNTTT